MQMEFGRGQHELGNWEPQEVAEVRGEETDYLQCVFYQQDPHATDS